MPLPYPVTPQLGTGEPLRGGTVLARFDVRALDAKGTYNVVVREMGKELARARIDFRALR
jgi:hypothetical protein